MELPFYKAQWSGFSERANANFPFLVEKGKRVHIFLLQPIPIALDRENIICTRHVGANSLIFSQLPCWSRTAVTPHCFIFEAHAVAFLLVLIPACIVKPRSHAMYKGGIYSPLLTGPPEDQETFWLCSTCPTRGYGLETFLCATTICSFALQEHIAGNKHRNRHYSFIASVSSFFGLPSIDISVCFAPTA